MKQETKSILKLIAKLILIFAIMIFTMLNYEALTNIDVRAIVDNTSSSIISYLCIIGIYILKGIVFVIPASLIYISVGMAFSPVQAITLNIIGIAAEVTVSYLFGYFVGGDYVNNLLGKNKGGKKLLELRNQNKQSSILVIRALPVFPIDFASLFFGSMKLSFPKYFVLSVIGIAPRVILFTILGDTMYDYFPMKFIVKIIIALIPFVAIGIIVKWIIDRRKKKDN